MSSQMVLTLLMMYSKVKFSWDLILRKIAPNIPLMFKFPAIEMCTLANINKRLDQVAMSFKDVSLHNTCILKIKNI